MCSMPVPRTVGEPARIGPGALLAALGEDLEPARAAEVYAALGYPVLPVFEPSPDGCTCRAGAGCTRAGKHPRITGGVWQATTDPAVVRRWWRRWPAANLALRTGVRFDVADVDGQPGVEALRALLTNADRPLSSGPLARTGGGAWHLLFAPTGSGSPKRVLPGVDWRGRGGYVLVAPSAHPSGRRYRWVQPLTLELPQAPAGLRGAQGPQRRAQPGRVQAGPARPRRPPGPRPGVRRAPRRRHRRRVGAGPQRPHDRQGDDRGPRQAAGHPRTTGAAAAMTQPPALRLAPDRLEYGPDGVPWPTTPMDQPTSNRHSHRNGNGHHPAQPPGRPVVPVDLAELARQGVPAPELVCHRLLYRGGLHSLAGPPDCGKSTLLYLWALELLAQGQRVVLLDEESGREQVTEKLLALGATPELLAPDRLIYQDFPARTWDHADHQALAELLERTRPALLGLDSAGAFLAVAGLSENESEHVTGFYKAVLLHTARTWNAAVVVLDHQGKSDEAGRYARGSGAKLALVDVHVDPDQGALALAFTPVDHTPGPDGTRAQEFPGDPAATDPGLAELAPAARKLLIVLRDAAGQPLTSRELVDRVKARWNHGLQRQTTSSALNELAKRGLADGEQGDDHGQKRWWAP